MSDNIEISYAMQVCDVFSYQNPKRFCGEDRTLLSKKSIKSLVNSIIFSSKKNTNVRHNLNLIEDNCTENLVSYITNHIVGKYDNITIQLTSLKEKSGIVESIRYCYDWLSDGNSDLVFQIQDDYLFSLKSIDESVDVFFQVLNETNSHAVVQPYNNFTYWWDYNNKSTPRCLFLGKSGYWIQIYDTSCSFLTSRIQFNQHKDLYTSFLTRIPFKQQGNLENKSLNLMFTQRGVLGICPINTLTHHIQQYPDPYVDWKILWDQTLLED